ncbi:PQQ-binding-like beta-propeller repeat protein [Pedobacter sp. SYP-B3415]|uniref:outer membrane protein assembly factor BamB family protein n=1 Tax=Pedobacter sp. SYP-B3415 TaxID=2496641 RepID=UPI00101D37C1|nr:PQQ-binding-like beta-propeller repeat protein [Pedobacter sp. SYP-B3415]
MKIFLGFLFTALLSINAAAQQFRYAFVTDTHVGSDSGERDLRNTVADINELTDIDFVLVTGDLTEMGTNKELTLTKEILSGLNKPYHVIPGNHDTGWSESGGVSFIRTFGADKFNFTHKGFTFIGNACGPYVRMSDGHIPRDGIIWMDKVLKDAPAGQRIVFINHYPLDNSLDNWYEATDRLKRYNIQYAICGHGHQNQPYDFEGIKGTMGRSNLRAKDSIGGYNIVTMRTDSVFFAEKRPGQALRNPWRKFGLETYHNDGRSYARPDSGINARYPEVRKSWTYHSAANVVNTPLQHKKLVIFGNSLGTIEALSADNGKKIWSFQTGGAIYSSAASWKDLVITGSGDGKVYALRAANGKPAWTFAAKQSVLGSPLVEGKTVYIGSSDSCFRALDARSGKVIWTFNGLGGTIVGKPLITGNTIVFGSWDRHLYALDTRTGALLWKWNNGNGNRMLSPAMCTPVEKDGVIYISAPDRTLSAIDLATGQTLWRNNEARVRESTGIAADGSFIYAKTMQDEVVAFKPGRTNSGIAWRLNVGFGYEHAPSMLIAGKDKVYFGTRNGVVYAISPDGKATRWGHKVDNSMVNTVNVLAGRRILVSTMDGVVTMLQEQ